MICLLRSFWILLWILNGSFVYAEQFFNTLPPPLKTNFSCRGRPTGFYADIDSNCRAYHMCDENGNNFDYYCPAETAFRQEALVCDHAHLVNCASGRRHTEASNEALENERRDHQNEKSSGSKTSNFQGFFNPRHSQDGNTNAEYTRSFRIGQAPQSAGTEGKSLSKSEPPFVFSSSVFLRDMTNSIKSISNNSKKFNGTISNFASLSQANRASGRISASTTTSRPSTLDFKVKNRFDQTNDFQPRDFEAERGFAQNRLGRFKEDENPRKLYTTSTERPFINLNLGFRVGANSQDPPNREKFKFERTTEREPTKNFASQAERKNQGHTNLGSQEVAGFSKLFENLKNPKTTSTERTTSGRPFDFHSVNFPYSETLRSMQAPFETPYGSSINKINYSTSVSTSTSPTTAGTEFPVPSFDEISHDPNNPFDDDPYYPKLSATTETYYKLANDKKALKFSPRRPTPPETINFEIPDVLPDFNTLDDLVDRRKIFFIPRVKNN